MAITNVFFCVLIALGFNINGFYASLKQFDGEVCAACLGHARVVLWPSPAAPIECPGPGSKVAVYGVGREPIRKAWCGGLWCWGAFCALRVCKAVRFTFMSLSHLLRLSTNLPTLPMAVLVGITGGWSGCKHWDKYSISLPGHLL